MRKIRVHGKIKDKFMIRHKLTRETVHENKGIPYTISRIRCPAFFNTEKDARDYIDSETDSDEEKNSCSIEPTVDSFFKDGGILIINEEDSNKLRYKVIDKSSYIYSITECTEDEIINKMNELKDEEERTNLYENYRRSRAIKLSCFGDVVDSTNFDLWCEYFGYEIHLID